MNEFKVVISEEAERFAVYKNGELLSVRYYRGKESLDEAASKFEFDGGVEIVRIDQADRGLYYRDNEFPRLFKDVLNVPKNSWLPGFYEYGCGCGCEEEESDLEGFSTEELLAEIGRRAVSQNLMNH